MGRFIIQLLLEDKTWSIQYTIAKNTQYSDSPTDCTLLNLDFTIQSCGMKYLFYQIDTPHSDICLSNITTTHFVNYNTHKIVNIYILNG